ncbi:MAG TPA: TonB-dependent receptor [Puia sp.]|nr:TonB-dependent receptor [Puia sp.]
MKKERLRLLPLTLLFSLFLHAQKSDVITGTVTNSKTGEALEGVTITVNKQTTGTTSRADGTYSITASPGTRILSFSFVGFIKQTVEIKGETRIDISLTPDNNNLNEAIVIGYGTQRKRDLTGSVVSIGAKELAETPITRPDQMLQGRASGVQVIQTNSAPGGNISIRIRGTNSINSSNEPLFVIDGFPGAGDLNTINPQDIESIEILKDASSTAIYGSRGANGVVLITTKRGRPGSQSVNFESYYGLQKVSKTYHMMDATQFATYLDSVTAQNNRLTNTTTALPYTSAQIGTLGKGTDWEQAVLRTAPIQSYQLSLNGGTTDSRYNLSGNYFDQEGIVINSWFKRGTLRFNFDKTISPKVRMGLASQFAFSSQNQALINTNGGASGGTMYDALRFNPALSIKDSTGAYTYVNGPAPYVDLAGNPVAYALNTTNKTNNFRALTDAFLEYEIVRGLKYKALVGADIEYTTLDFYTPSTLYLSTQNTSTGNAVKNANTSYTWVNENTLTYDKKLNSNNVINAVAGFSWQVFQQGTLSGASNGFFTNDLGTNNLSIGSNPLVPGSSQQKNTLASYFGRVNYRLFEKYLFTATMRADGSSRFGVGNKWGYFPSGAVAWRLIDENFIRDLNTFSDLKLRVGYGVIGNQEIGDYQSIPQYVTSTANSYTLDNVRVVGVAINNIPNPNLSWEQTASTDLGLDFGLLNNRLTGTIDLYTKKTTRLLFNEFVPTTSGFSSELINAGSVGNKGIDIGLDLLVVDRKDFSWRIFGDFSSNSNKVLNLNGTNNLLAGNSSTSIFTGGGQSTTILRVGQPIGSFYGYKFAGIWQNAKQIAASGQKSPVVNPGDPIYVDENGDSSITGADRVIIGHALPKFIYGFTNNLRWRQLSLSVFIQGVYGDNILNENLYDIQNGFSTDNKLASVAHSWTGDGTSNTLPRVSSTLRRSTGITSDVIEDGSYLRLKTVSLSYNVFMHAHKTVKSLLLYITGQNLITVTHYSGFDPEVNSYGNNSNANNLSLNTDYGSYPSARSFLLGIKMGL